MMIGIYAFVAFLIVVLADRVLVARGVWTGWTNTPLYADDATIEWGRGRLTMIERRASWSDFEMPGPTDPWDNWQNRARQWPPAPRSAAWNLSLRLGLITYRIDDFSGLIEGEMLITEKEYAWRLRVPMPAGPITERSYIGPPGTIPPEPPDSAWRTEVRWLSLLGNTLIFAVFLALITLLPLRFVRNRRAAWRAKRGRCPSCGYAALTPDQPECPNCGPVGGGARSIEQAGQVQ